MPPEAPFIGISTFWIIVLIFAGIALLGIYLDRRIQEDNFPKPERQQSMIKKVEGVNPKPDSLAEEYLLTYAIGDKKSPEDCHNFLRNHEKYRAKIVKFLVKGTERTYLYEMGDNSLLEIVENPAEELRSYSIKKGK